MILILLRMYAVLVKLVFLQLVYQCFLVLMK